MTVGPGAPGDDDVDFDTAVAEPRAFYANPEAISADATLAPDQQRRFLRQWREELASPPAGGEADSPHVVEDAAAMVARIDTALAAVAPEEPGRVAQGRRWWPRSPS